MIDGGINNCFMGTRKRNVGAVLHRAGSLATGSAITSHVIEEAILKRQTYHCKALKVKLLASGNLPFRPLYQPLIDCMRVSGLARYFPSSVVLKS